MLGNRTATTALAGPAELKWALAAEKCTVRQLTGPWKEWAAWLLAEQWQSGAVGRQQRPEDSWYRRELSGICDVSNICDIVDICDNNTCNIGDLHTCDNSPWCSFYSPLEFPNNASSAGGYTCPVAQSQPHILLYTCRLLFRLANKKF